MKIESTFFSMLAMLALVSCSHEKSDATGVFEAPMTTVSAETSGKILSINASEGDLVCAGNQLLLIDTVQLFLKQRLLESQRQTASAVLSDAKTQTESLRMQQEQLRKEQARLDRLVKAGAATPQQKEQIDNNILTLEWQIKALEENISDANAAHQGNAASLDIQIESVKDLIRRCHVTSPSSGTIVARYVEEGEVVAEGMPLFKQIDLNKIYLRAYFEGRRMSEVKLGRMVKLRTLFGGNEREYDGTISWISPESEFTPKSIMTSDDRSNLVYAVKITVENDGFLRNGLYGEVWLK